MNKPQEDQVENVIQQATVNTFVEREIPGNEDEYHRRRLEAMQQITLNLQHTAVENQAVIVWLLHFNTSDAEMRSDDAAKWQRTFAHIFQDKAQTPRARLAAASILHEDEPLSEEQQTIALAIARHACEEGTTDIPLAILSYWAIAEFSDDEDELVDILLAASTGNQRYFLALVTAAIKHMSGQAIVTFLEELEEDDERTIEMQPKHFGPFALVTIRRLFETYFQEVDVPSESPEKASFENETDGMDEESDDPRLQYAGILLQKLEAIPGAFLEKASALWHAAWHCYRHNQNEEAAELLKDAEEAFLKDQSMGRDDDKALIKQNIDELKIRILLPDEDQEGF